MSKLDWKCMYIRANEIKPTWNNICYPYWEEEIKKRRKNGKIKNREDLKQYLKSECMYHYWSKCEFETIVTSWPPRKNEEGTKIDVWDQIEPNLDRLTDYIIIELGLKFK